MHTFNMAFVFEDGPVITLVCASEKPINTQYVQGVATKAFKAGNRLQRIDKVLDFVIDHIRQECGCECVKVVADVYVSFPRRT